MRKLTMVLIIPLLCTVFNAGVLVAQVGFTDDSFLEYPNEIRSETKVHTDNINRLPLHWLSRHFPSPRRSLHVVYPAFILPFSQDFAITSNVGMRSGSTAFRRQQYGFLIADLNIKRKFLRRFGDWYSPYCRAGLTGLLSFREIRIQPLRKLRFSAFPPMMVPYLAVGNFFRIPTSPIGLTVELRYEPTIWVYGEGWTALSMPLHMSFGVKLRHPTHH